ncbi:MAG: GGDEF domain-containing protein [Sphingobium sp.]
MADGSQDSERQVMGLAGMQGGTSLPAATPEELKATVEELRGEVTALRRELRLLRIANTELERVAVRDTLTPLYNRRYFLTAINERLVRAKRYSFKAALLFIDVNRMKYINDAYGHGAGDFALIHVAQIVQAHIRATDVAARIGGDEFAVILEEVDNAQAEAKAAELDAVLRETRCAYGDTDLPLSASIGLTMLHPNDTDDALIERADADMYARKRESRKSRASADRKDGEGSAAA